MKIVMRTLCARSGSSNRSPNLNNEPHQLQDEEILYRYETLCVCVGVGVCVSVRVCECMCACVCACQKPMTMIK